MQAIVDVLSTSDMAAPKEAYELLHSVLTNVSPRELRNAHHSYTSRLRLIQNRLNSAVQLTPGLTTHQAKGQEWDVVGLRLTTGQHTAVSAGLDPANDDHRKLCVAGTRARAATRIIT